MVNYHPMNWVASWLTDPTRSPVHPERSLASGRRVTEVMVSSSLVDSGCPIPIEMNDRGGKYINASIHPTVKTVGFLEPNVVNLKF